MSWAIYNSELCYFRAILCFNLSCCDSHCIFCPAERERARVQPTRSLVRSSTRPLVRPPNSVESICYMTPFFDVAQNRMVFPLEFGIRFAARFAVVVLTVNCDTNMPYLHDDFKIPMILFVMYCIAPRSISDRHTTYMRLCLLVFSLLFIANHPFTFMNRINKLPLNENKLIRAHYTCKSTKPLVCASCPL